MCGSAPPPPPPPPPPPKIPQMAKVPDQDVFKKKNRADATSGFGAGYAGTLLTGSGGAPTPSGNLGGNTLLGK